VIPDDPLLDLARAVGDGDALEWDSLECTTASSDVGVLRNLRSIASIAGVCRTFQGGAQVERGGIGGSWGHLEIREPLGRGSAGDVYAAWDPRLETDVALKVLHTMNDETGAERIDEARRTARVRHPNVVSVHGADVQDGRVGVWMELVHGRSLEALLRDQGPFGWREATVIGMDLCAALAAVHQAGLLHRDLKAQNVLREEGGRIVLMDFSTGIEAESAPDATAAGTPLYLAPEVLLGKPATERSDIYSLGVLLFHLVTGRYPVHGRSLAELKAAHGQARGSRLIDVRADVPETFAAVVDRALAADPQTRHESAGELRQALAHALGIPSMPSSGSSATYRLLRKLGEGAVGEVWLAEQTEPVRRQVALKVIKTGMDSKQVVARFDAERQALALMNHPAIAKVFDGGLLPDGRPFIAMEYVPGEPINSYCDRTRLTIPGRLALFIEICDGVQHAHQKGVIHRDLKPSNVLVTAAAGEPPIAKIIDFGVAKAIAMPLTERTLLTEVGALIGTLEYMSPEQAEMGVKDIDTRADVYALGVILYELLTGVLPFDVEQLRSVGLDEIRRLIREVDPPRPSARVGSLGDRAVALAANRSAPPARLAAQFRGDLDWIVMKAIEKDRERRYASAADLRADVGRHLADEPVAASPPGLAYRMRKLARRHRTAVVAAAVCLLAVVAGSAAVAIFAVRAAAARRVAEEELRRAREVEAFTSSIFSSIDPEVAQQMDKSLLKLVLGQAAAEMQHSLAAFPAAQAAMELRIGTAYTSIDEPVLAEPHLARARDFFRRTTGEMSRDTLLADSAFASNLGSQDQLAQAEVLARNAYERARAALPDSDADRVSVEMSLALILKAADKFPEAFQLAREAYEERRRLLGDDHPSTVMAAIQAADAAAGAGDHASCQALMEAAFRTGRETLGPHHPAWLELLRMKSEWSRMTGHDEDALRFAKEALDGMREVFGPDNRLTLSAMMEYGMSLRRTGRGSEGQATQEEALRRTKQAFGPTDRDVMYLENILGQDEAANGDPAKGVAMLQRVVATNSEGDATQRGVTEAALGQALTRLGRYGEAEEVLNRAEREFGAKASPGSRLEQLLAERMVALYESWDRRDPRDDRKRNLELWRAKLK
jgi:serine/threonine protein kinase/tetratricopeptide (TPR) repeat protein